MPKNTQNLNRKIEKKEKRNAKISLSALDDESSLYGKAIKALGNKRFRIIVPDARGALREEEARIGGKSVIRIEINDIVVVVRSGRDLEIMGRMDKKNTARLQKDNRIHPALLTAGEITTEMMKNPVVKEEGFEFDYEDTRDTESSNDNEDVDIDNI